MEDKHLVIVGGGLAGLSAGCYALASGYRTTIVEHNSGLGGVCTAWPRGPYVVDGCIHWLTGGAFSLLYEELGILPSVKLKTIEHWLRWRDARDGRVVNITRNLAQLADDLCAISPEDGAEIVRLVREAEAFSEIAPPIDHPPEIATLWQQLHGFWDMRKGLGPMLHFHKPIGMWAEEQLRSQQLRRLFTGLVPAEAPALFLLMVLGYLKRGWLSRPIGGTAAFRDALISSYERLGGKALTHATVDEIVVEDGRATGVRLADGTLLPAHAVISTSSAPETVLRLLGGRYDAAATRERMEQWKMFQPIVLASFGVDVPLADLPGMVLVDRVEPFQIGSTQNDRVYLRVCNDDASHAPRGHAVVQAMLNTDYAFWATQGTGYELAKNEVARAALEQVARIIPGIQEHVRMTDIATPLTFHRQARSWRGAYEGWMPNAASMFGHVPKKLSGLAGFYMAGQWVEPGGGVPTAVMSGRQAVQILCDDERHSFLIPAW